MFLGFRQLESFKRHVIRRHALTLLELLVVLVILAIVATVAVNSLQPRVEAARFDETQAQLNRVREAVIGPELARQADGTPLLSGFVADIGRLPSAIFGSSTDDASPVDSSQGSELSELWSVQTNLASTFPFQFRSGPSAPVNYSDIQIPCGWRGPYLQLPMGQTSLRDSWGRPFEIESTIESEVQALSWRPIGDYSQALQADLTAGKVSVTGAINFGQTVPSKLVVVLLVPDPNSSQTELVVLADEDSNETTFSFSNVPIGLRAICVSSDSKRLLTKYVHVPHRGLSLIFDLTQDNPGVPPEQSDE